MFSDYIVLHKLATLMDEVTTALFALVCCKCSLKQRSNLKFPP